MVLTFQEVFWDTVIDPVIQCALVEVPFKVMLNDNGWLVIPIVSIEFPSTILHFKDLSLCRNSSVLARLRARSDIYHHCFYSHIISFSSVFRYTLILAPQTPTKYSVNQKQLHMCTALIAAIIAVQCCKIQSDFLITIDFTGFKQPVFRI